MRRLVLCLATALLVAAAGGCLANAGADREIESSFMDQVAHDPFPTAQQSGLDSPH